MIRSVAWTLLFAATMEWQIAVVLQHSWARFFAAMALYAVLGACTARSFDFVARRFADPAQGFWAATFAHGLVGLVVLEWAIMGHAPGSVPDPTLAVIAQLGMLAWWCTMAAMPRLLEHPAGRHWRWPILLLYGTYSVVSTTLALHYGLAPVILLMPPTFVAFFWFYFKHARALRAEVLPR